MDELDRFLKAVGHGEVWERRGDRWLLEADHAQATVKPPAWPEPSGRFAWGVQLLPAGALIVGTAETEHEAMRSAERVVEEHRPQLDG
jgi:hypothetical protein